MTNLVNIGDLHIRYRDKLIRLDRHPYYLAFARGSEKLYKKALKGNARQASKSTGTWEGVCKLISRIKTDGFKISSGRISIRRKHGKTYCLHGRHRMCILLYLYGRQVQFEVGRDENVLAIIVNGRTVTRRNPNDPYKEIPV